MGLPYRTEFNSKYNKDKWAIEPGSRVRESMDGLLLGNSKVGGGSWLSDLTEYITGPTWGRRNLMRLSMVVRLQG